MIRDPFTAFLYLILLATAFWVWQSMEIGKDANGFETFRQSLTGER